jgi:SNF2 family DNA or RNA helicase
MPESDLHDIDLPTPLRPYQWDGVSFLVSGQSAVLADEMGLGKTVQASVALRIVLNRIGIDRALIITPASLRLNWLRELEHWAPSLAVRLIDGRPRERRAMYELPAQVLLASYEQIRADAAELAGHVKFDIVLLDEAQRIKNPASTTALACKMVSRSYGWALSGTPVENSLDDLVAVFSFAHPGLLKIGMSRQVMHRRMKPFFLRRRKTEVLRDLPPIILQDLPLEMSGPQKEAYESLREAREMMVAEAGLPSTDMHLLALITRLKQVCNFDPASNTSVKLDALRVILDGLIAADDKVIVFSQYVETLTWLSEQIADLPHSVFHGGLSERERDRFIAEFEHEPGPRAIFISLKAGGVGLNLNSASTVVMFDRWWNPASENQAMQRAHRFGRHRPLHVIRFLVQDSIEERIAAVLATKEAIFSEYVDNAESSVTARLTRDELRQALGLRTKQIDGQ